MKRTFTTDELRVLLHVFETLNKLELDDGSIEVVRDTLFHSLFQDIDRHMDAIQGIQSEIIETLTGPTVLQDLLGGRQDG